MHKFKLRFNKQILKYLTSKLLARYKKRPKETSVFTKIESHKSQKQSYTNIY